MNGLISHTHPKQNYIHSLHLRFVVCVHLLRYADLTFRERDGKTTKIKVLWCLYGSTVNSTQWELKTISNRV